MAELNMGKKRRDRAFNKKQSMFEAAVRDPKFQADLALLKKHYPETFPKKRGSKTEYLKRMQNVQDAAWLLADKDNQLPKEYEGLEWSLDYCKIRCRFLRYYGFSDINLGEALDWILIGKAPPVRNVAMHGHAPTKNLPPGTILLRIDPSASQDDISRFLSEKWEAIKVVRKNAGIKSIKSPRTKSEEMDVIMKYDAMSLEKLRKLVGAETDTIPKMVLMSRALKKDGFELGPEAIRGRLSRFKKRLRRDT